MAEKFLDADHLAHLVTDQKHPQPFGKPSCKPFRKRTQDPVTVRRHGKTEVLVILNSNTYSIVPLAGAGQFQAGEQEAPPFRNKLSEPFWCEIELSGIAEHGFRLGCASLGKSQV